MTPSAVVLRPMAVADLPQVIEIERRSFSLPWSLGSFRSDLLNNPAARLLVAERGGRVMGYVGLWHILDEAHVSTLAVAPDDRRGGIGEVLMRAALATAAAEGAASMTLEVRASNQAAQRLYQRLGFEVVGTRRRYYQDNLEDAVLMTRGQLARRHESDGVGDDGS